MVKFLSKVAHSEAFWLVVLGAVAAAVRLYRMTAASMWVDEAWTIATVHNSLKDIFIITKFVDFHPPLYYFLLHGWIELWGRSPFAVRSLSVLIELGSLAALFLLARAIGGRSLAWTAALLYSFSALMVMTSQEARMYPLLNCLTLIACYNFYQALVTGRWRYWLGFTLALGLALYTHYLACFLALALGLAYLALLLGRKVAPRSLLGASVSLLGLFLGYLPWLLILMSRVSERGAMGNPNPLAWLGFCLMYTLFILEAGYTLLLPEPGYFIALAGLALPALLGIFALRRNPVAAVLLSALLFIPPLGEAGAYLLTSKQIYHPYHFTALGGYFYLLSAAGLVLLARRRLSLILVLPWLYFWLLYNGIAHINWLYNPYYQREDWNTVVGLVHQMERPDDVILVQTGHRFYPFWYAHRGKAKAYPMDNLGSLKPGTFLNKKRAWLIQNCAGVMDPRGEVAAMLESMGRRVFTYFEDNYRENGKMYITLYILR